jgi:sortase (surface protein transpeptidase)
MRRVLVVLTAALLLGSCASHVDQDPSNTTPTTSRAERARENVQKRQVDRKAVIPRQFYSRRVGHAPVVPIHLDGNTLVPPANPQVLGWWGSKVGAKKGTTLLIGHTVHTGGGFLNDLDQKVPVGASVVVSGHVYHVVSNRDLSKLKVAQIAPRLFSQASAPKLVVVTCDGYNPVTGTYRQNTVLVAK